VHFPHPLRSCRARITRVRQDRAERDAATAADVPDNRVRRWLAALTAGTLSAITGVVSYNHGLDVVRWTGTTGYTAYLVPLVPDLMIVASSLVLIEASASAKRRPATAMGGLVAGIGWTVAQNVAAGWRNGVGGALIAAGIPLAFVLTFESLLWLYRNRRKPARTGLAADAGVDPGTVASLIPDSAEDAAALQLLLTTVAGNPLSQNALADRFGLTRPQAQRVRDAVGARLNGREALTEN
jgi:hypothetical protein